MSDRFDAIRAANPTLAINLYAMTPGGAVTLEVIEPDGSDHQWIGETASQVLDLAFPETAPVEPTPTAAQPTGSIFD